MNTNRPLTVAFLLCAFASGAVAGCSDSSGDKSAEERQRASTFTCVDGLYDWVGRQLHSIPLDGYRSFVVTTDDGAQQSAYPTQKLVHVRDLVAADGRPVQLGSMRAWSRDAPASVDHPRTNEDYLRALYAANAVDLTDAVQVKALAKHFKDAGRRDDLAALLYQVQPSEPDLVSAIACDYAVLPAPPTSAVAACAPPTPSADDGPLSPTPAPLPAATADARPIRYAKPLSIGASSIHPMDLNIDAMCAEPSKDLGSCQTKTTWDMKLLAIKDKPRAAACVASEQCPEDNDTTAFVISDGGKEHQFTYLEPAARNERLVFKKAEWTYEEDDKVLRSGSVDFLSSLTFAIKTDYPHWQYKPPNMKYRASSGELLREAKFVIRWTGDAEPGADGKPPVCQSSYTASMLARISGVAHAGLGWFWDQSGTSGPDSPPAKAYTSIQGLNCGIAGQMADATGVTVTVQGEQSSSTETNSGGSVNASISCGTKAVEQADKSVKLVPSCDKAVGADGKAGVTTVDKTLFEWKEDTVQTTCTASLASAGSFTCPNVNYGSPVTSQYACNQTLDMSPKVLANMRVEGNNSQHWSIRMSSWTAYPFADTKVSTLLESKLTGVEDMKLVRGKRVEVPKTPDIHFQARLE